MEPPRLQAAGARPGARAARRRPRGRPRLLVFGIEPGPRIITNDLDVVYTIVYSFAIASVLGALLCFAFNVPLAKLSFVRFPVLAAGLIVILFTAGYQESKPISTLQVMLLLGAIGWSLGGLDAVVTVANLARTPFGSVAVAYE